MKRRRRRRLLSSAQDEDAESGGHDKHGDDKRQIRGYRNGASERRLPQTAAKLGVIDFGERGIRTIVKPGQHLIQRPEQAGHGKTIATRRDQKVEQNRVQRQGRASQQKQPAFAQN